MPQVRPPCPTAEHALSQAVTAAVESLDTPGRLAAVTFGRFADPNAGWHWELDVTRRYASNPKIPGGTRDTLEERVWAVVQAWKRDTARYPKEETG